MCIIAIKPKNAKMFSDEEIETMFDNNSDGCGLAFNNGHKVVMKKGFMKVKDLLDYLHNKDFTNKDLMLHFRIGTSGKLDESNCHPFKVKKGLYFAHNGILSDYATDKIKNDTQVFNEKVLRKINCYKLFKDKDYQLLFKNIIDTNKFAFIDRNKFYMIGDFVKKNGRFYSNHSFEKTTYKKFDFTNSHSYKGYGSYDYFSEYYGKDYDYLDDDDFNSFEEKLGYMYGVENNNGVMRFKNDIDFEDYLENYCELYADNVYYDYFFDKTFKANKDTLELKLI